MTSEAKSLAFANCHCKMNTFGWLLKGCCHRGFAKWAKTSDEDWDSFEIAKSVMIDEFWDKMKLPVCGIAPGGGTTNTGPTVKAAFNDPKVLSEIVHCPEDLVQDLKDIFDALDSGLIVDWKKFRLLTESWLDR